ncbi:MAG: hypothetical protein GX549_02985 [Clostridiales bacterium]|nr:hypothetical protein [Clostridiales bacterium]
MDSKNWGGAGALLVLAAVAALLYLFRHMWLALLIAVGVIAALAAVLLVLLNRYYKKKKTAPGAKSASAAELPNILRHYYNIRDPRMKQLMKDIDDEQKKMRKTVADDPRDRPAAERFMRTALAGACRIAEGYARLEKAPPGVHEAHAAREKALVTMGSIHKAFIEQNGRLFRNDILHLDIETEVLDKTLKAQGYQPVSPASATGKEPHHE